MRSSTGSAPRSLQDIKEQVKERADLVEIVGRYTKLIKVGPKFKGCCPFHKEKTPSFYVNPQENFFHCFGCEAGGDVFSFLMKAEGLSFMEALKDLADSLHLEIPTGTKFSEDASRETFSERAAGHEMLDRAARFYNRVLMSEATPGAKQALAYLRKRGIPDSEIDSLLVGWAPESGNGLLKKLTSESDAKIALKVGLIRDGQNGSYEFFRSRVTIPIRDVKGRTCAFSGRTMSEVTGQNPKYKNSSESEWFKKKEVLYGLDHASKMIRGEDFVCIVEGYFDQWAFERHGIPAVAVMGTALSEEHLKLLGRYTKRVILVLDSDKAGVDSTLKVIPMFMRGEWNVSVFSGLEGKDPDEWLGQPGRETGDLKQKLLSSPEAIEWWTKLVLNETLADGIGRLEIFKRVSTPWKFAASKAHKSVLADEIGRILGLPPKTVWESLNEMAGPTIKNIDVSAPPKLMLEKQSAAKSPVEEAFVWWMSHWNVLTPKTEAEWTEREALFSRTPAERAIAELRVLASKSGWTLENWGPRQWLEAGVEDAQIKTWIQKGLVLKQGPDERPNELKVLTSFREITSILDRERVHFEISKLQSRIRALAPSSPELSQLLQKAQELRLSLEKTK